MTSTEQESAQSDWKSRAKAVYRFGRRTGKRFSDDDCPQMAAALAFYAVFSLPSLLLIVIAIIGVVFDTDAAKAGIRREASRFLGPEAVQQIGAIVENAEQPGGRALATAFGIGALIFGATGALAQLQDALNRIWRVEPDPERGGIKQFALKRVLSFAMVLAISFLLLASLVISAVLAAVGDMLGEWVGSGITGQLVWAAHMVASFAVIVVLFALIFKVFPEAETDWRDAFIGAAFTTALFVTGKNLFGIYLGNSNVGNAYGAAGSLLLMIMWIFFSALVVLLGAEFTWSWANRFGSESRPSDGAVHVEHVKCDVRSEKDAESVAALHESEEREKQPVVTTR